MMCALRLAFTTLKSQSHCVRRLLPFSTRLVGGVVPCSSSSTNQNEEVEGAKKERQVGDKLVNGDVYPIIDPLTSMEYMQSASYKMAYGDVSVWRNYRRNFKGQWAPQTRKTCIRGGKMATGNPCPVCRDEYLVINYQNLKLINQFLSPHTGELLPTKTTGICQKQMKNLKIAVEIAEDHGLLEGRVPFKKYNYAEYFEASGTS